MSGVSLPRLAAAAVNLGYYTGVEQRGVSVEDFDRRKDRAFWRGPVRHAAVWDEMIDGMNRMIAEA